VVSSRDITNRDVFHTYRKKQKHKLAKEGTSKIEQTDITLSYEEAKCTIKAAYKKEWKQNHP
jgi:hypothetical protein